MSNTNWPGKALYERYLGYFMPSGDASTEHRISVANLVIVSMMGALLVPAFVAEYAVLGMWNLALPLLAVTPFMLGAPLIYRCSGSLALAREIFILALFGFKTWESIVFGGAVSPGSLWYIACPLMAIMLGSTGSALTWLAISSASLVAMQTAMGDNVHFTVLATAYPHFAYIFSLIGVSVAIALFLALIEMGRRDAFHRLEVANHTINELAIRDALTGVYNRRRLGEEIDRTDASGNEAVCICLLDLDRFKWINDNCGHAAGDEVLKVVAATIQQEVRQQDCFGRYGGEEFLLLLRHTGIEGGEQFVERIRQRIEALQIPSLRDCARVTVSAGIAERRAGERCAQTISRADAALYAAKEAGRNRVMLATA
ncbi:GGDEF domain-containing protein [Noviherbaspirillum pedocola]|uniref:diguanylate cyclase n=1 Tax=Noviherbaspirillum pedocola TaxID=2801341 RepID=A0A934SWR6_9BURK|nr:GGDEF domain-containing protein [Noviherbaspirillum pedocola]MBK4737059.1 diguanylate cyclase [Noviherbaspirillum pedocola]